MNCLPRLASALLCLVPLARLAAQDSNYYSVAKFANVAQTGPGAPGPNPVVPFNFFASAPVGGTVSGPGGSINSLTSVPSDSDYEFGETFQTQAQLDATFPSGTYTITPLTGAVGNITLTGNAYPPAPQIQNAYWNASGQLELDPTKPYTFQFSPFPGFTTPGTLGQAVFAIEQVTPSPLLGATSAAQSSAPGSYTLAAGTLIPGDTYTARLDYVTYVVTDTTSVPGLVLLGSYGVSNQFVILAVAPPVSPLVITSQPVSQTVSSGSTVVFTFGVTGQPPPSYQWYFNGSPIDGSTPTIKVVGATAVNAGTYSCVATSSSGSVQSNSVTLAISSNPDVGRLINLSCRAQVGTGSNVLITGFAIGGGGAGATEPLLVRGSGPALVPFGVTGTLPDPLLQEYAGSTVEASDFGWDGSSAIASAAAQVHAFAWSATSQDSALLVAPTTGAYTVEISGKSGDSGVALAEVYDATPAGTYTSALPRLVNLSARVQVGTGGNILIAGFVIGGSTAKTVLIRASGPALVPFGVAGTLPDPQLQLFAGSTLLATNAGWGGTSLLASTFSAVGAFGWDAASQDSALLVTLAPGAYTAQVTGASGDTGVALIEVYEVP
jgi:hypothetical protein